TFSSIIFKSNTAHLFHIGDSRIYRLAKNGLEQLTKDHRQVISNDEDYLSNALGIREFVDLDYRAISVDENDTFVLTTDGVHEQLSEKFICDTILAGQTDLDSAAKSIVEAALEAGSEDNLTIQVVRIDQLPEKTIHEIQQQIDTLPFPPKLAVRQNFDGFEIIREIYISNRSHLFLVKDIETQQQLVLKAPSEDMKQDTNYLEGFLTEEWVARRINNIHVMKTPTLTRKRNYLYQVMELIDGQTLEQWMQDNPTPSLEQVRKIIEQIAKGLLAFHRQEMLHQDLRPKNVMIDNDGTVKIIDFGAARVAGIAETRGADGIQTIMGTLQYTAPEYFIGNYATPLSDLFSLGVITYQMLSGKLPYGNSVSQCRSRKDILALSYSPLRHERTDIPLWVDEVIKKAIHVDPMRRYAEVAEFAYELRHPNPKLLTKHHVPLMAKNPVLFWQSISFILFLICLAQIIL
ncbi:MAG: bifunctional protein-serine/threonine kinase/phosphatase, partial [Pseudomonadota bacterium]